MLDVTSKTVGEENRFKQLKEEEALVALMMLVSAFAGYDEIRKAYQHAIANEYRFFSFGDAMLLTTRSRS